MLGPTDGINTTILLAGNSTRFVNSKPSDFSISHKSLCKINRKPLIQDIIWKLNHTPFKLNINIVINDKCNSNLRNVVNKIADKFNSKNLTSKISIVEVPYYESNAHSLLASLDSFALCRSRECIEYDPFNLIIDGDTYISRESIQIISHAIVEATSNRINILFGSRLKNFNGEWGLGTTSVTSKPYPRLVKIDKTPNSNKNLITTGISYICSNKLRNYLVDSLRSGSIDYWDEFYNPDRNNPENTYVVDLGNALVYEIDTYQDYLGLQKAIFEYKRGTYK